MRRPQYATQTLPTNYLPKRGTSLLGCIAIASTEHPMARAMVTAQMPSHMADLPQLAEATNAPRRVWFPDLKLKYNQPLKIRFAPRRCGRSNTQQKHTTSPRGKE